MISKRSHHQWITSIFDHLNNSVIKRILVLLQPSSQVVRYSCSVVNDCKVCIGVLSWVRFGKLRPFSKHVGHQLLKHVNTFLEIHAKIHVSPVKTLFHILLLLKGKHVLIEELLELLVDVVDANLLEAVVVKDLEPGNIEDTNIGDLLHGWITKGFITLINYKAEGALIDATSNTRNRACSSGTGGTLLDPFSTDLQLGLAKVGDHPFTVNAT